MENSQSVQQQASEVKKLTSKSEKTHLKLKGGAKFLIHLLTRYPWLLLFGLLAVFFGSAVFSVYSLSYVEHVEQEDSEEVKAEVVKLTPAPSDSTNPISLWSLGAITASCGGGCLLLLLLLKLPGNRQKVKKYIKRYPARKASSSSQATLEPRPPQNLPTFPQPVLPTSVATTPGNTKPVITVLPPEQPSQNQQSLAHILDIRKQTPLSTILRKN
jgi:hypothetical protein